MLKKLFHLLLYLCFLVSPLGAETLQDFAKRLPASDDPEFKAAIIRDLSVYQTWSREQSPTGMCPTFSIIGAIEAAYTRKYCGDPNSAFYKAGYCERYEALKAANMPPFYLADSEHYYFHYQKKDLDLSELYFADRVHTSMTTSASSAHESGNIFCHTNGVPEVGGAYGIPGMGTLLLSEIRIPEEKYAEFIYDSDFYPTIKETLFGGDCESGTAAQESIDAYEFSDRKLDFKYWDDRPLHRSFMPFDARRRARFGVSDAVFGSPAALADPITFLEKCIYAKYEVAVHGAQKGHSMLLIGYNRDRKKFLYKDHYHRFVEVDYQTTKDHINSFDIVVQPFAGFNTASKEEMWVGPWDVMLDGQYARLVIRRTRLAPNAGLSAANLYNTDIQPISTTSWARIGSFYELDGSKHAAYGRLNDSNGDTLEMIVDFDQPEPPPPSVKIVGTPAGKLFRLRMFTGGDGVGAYVTGDAAWQGKIVGVLIKRPGQNPYGLIPVTPATSFTKSKWLGRFLVRVDGTTPAYLELGTDDDLKTLKGTFQHVDGAKATVTATFDSDNRISLSGKYSAGTTFWGDYFFLESDHRLITGTYDTAYTTTKPAFGYRIEQAGESRLHTRMFFPYYDLMANCFNGFAVSNAGTSMGILKFTAFTNAGDPAIAPQNPSSWYLPPGNQKASLASEIFGGKPTGATQSYWVELEGNSSQLGTFAQFGDGVQMLDGTVPWSGITKDVYFSRVYYGPNAFRGKSATTILAIANPGEEIATVRFDLIGPNGQTTGLSQPYIIGSKKVLQRAISDFFGEDIGTVSGGYLRAKVTAGSGIVAAAVVRLGGLNTAFSLNALYPESSWDLYSAQIARTSGYFTNVSLINSSDVVRTVTIKGVNSAGAAMGVAKTVTLLAGHTFSDDVAVVLSLPSSGDIVGSLKVEADGPGVIGDVVFGEPGNLSYVAALPLQGTPFKKALFSHVANGLGYFTGLAIYNPTEYTTPVSIKVYSKDGNLVGQANPNVGPGERLSKLLPEFVPASNGQLGGYVIVESGAGVVAQELFASGSLSFLSSVPPAVLE